jgi:hypothetical protein
VGRVISANPMSLLNLANKPNGTKYRPLRSNPKHRRLKKTAGVSLFGCGCILQTLRPAVGFHLRALNIG